MIVVYFLYVKGNYNNSNYSIIYICYTILFFNFKWIYIKISSIESSSLVNNFSIKEYQVPPAGSHPHDVAPSNSSQNNNTIVWFTAQATGQLGKLDKTTG